jgi:integrase
MAKDFTSLLKAANTRLKAANIRLSIYVPPGTTKLYLRGTLPPKPGSSHLAPHQQTLSLNLPGTPSGLIAAEAAAKRIAGQVPVKQFDWTDWLKAPTKEERSTRPTVQHWIVQSEEKYFESRARTLQTETTWRTNYHDVYKHLDSDAELTIDLLKATVLSRTKPNTRQRLRYVQALAALGRLSDIDVKPIISLKGAYSSSKTSERTLPSDEALLEAWQSLSHAPKWVQWGYGMLACYGLRPHELYSLDISDLESGGEKVRVMDATKTGGRIVLPLVPTGFDLDWLRTPHLPSQLNRGRPTTGAKCNQVLGNRISRAFRAWSVEAEPYDLRHAWAVRAIRRGLNVSIAARCLGHSVPVHTKTYQKWLSEGDVEAAFAKIGTMQK